MKKFDVEITETLQRTVSVKRFTGEAEKSSRSVNNED